LIAGFARAAVGAKLVLQGEDRKRGLLMIGAAAVLVGNVLVWTL
jgi:hypothetical protein